VGADVFINNKKAGRAPIERKAMPGNLAIVVSMDGYMNEIRSADIVAGETARIKIAMEKIYIMNPYKKWGHVAFWSGLGVTVFGGIAKWQAEKAADDYRKDGSSLAADRNKMWNGVGYTAFAIGGAMLVTGAVLWILSPGDAAWSERHPMAILPAERGDGLIITLSGGF